jgi:hypothetical protein
MARGKPKREKMAIPASYIRPRELPNGRKSYNVRAYNPATRTCKTLGTFKTRREAEVAFKKGAEALSRAKPEVAPTASAEPDDPRAPPSVSKKRARSPRATRASNRERRASAKSAELASPPAKRRKKNDASPLRAGVEPETRTGAPAEVTSPPTRRVSAVFRTLASAAAVVSPFAQSPTEASPGGESDSSRRGVVAKTFSTPAATPPSAPHAGGDMWSRVCAFIRGGEYPVPVPGLMDDEPGEPGDPGDGDVPRDEEGDSPGPAERLAAFLDSAVRRLRGGGAAAAGLEPRPAGVAVKSRGLTVTVDVRRA